MRRSSRLGLRPLREIAEAGLQCFTQRGFRLTQMSDIGAGLGMSPSAAYRYVESKEALFHIAALHAAGMSLEGLPMPVAVGDLAETVLSIETIVHSWPRWPALRAALDHPSPMSLLENEAAGIATELYDFLAATWRLIILFDRTANDIPSLKTAFTQQYRAPYLADIVTWFARRYAGDGPAEALARSGIEAISWLAMRRRTDPAAAAITEEEARRAASHCLYALLQAPQQRP